MLRKLETKKKWLIYFSLLLYWLIIFIATTLPAQDLPKTGISDKIEHLLAYMVLAVLLNITLMFQNKYPVIKKNSWLYTLIFSLTYAALDEIHQLYIPGRKCDIVDWLADAIGVLVGLAFVRLLMVYFRYKPQSG